MTQHRERLGCLSTLVLGFGSVAVQGVLIALGLTLLGIGVFVPASNLPGGWASKVGCIAGAVLVSLIEYRIHRAFERYSDKPIRRASADDEAADVLSDTPCRGCGQSLRKVQVKTMLGNAAYETWCREGYCSLACYSAHG